MMRQIPSADQGFRRVSSEWVHADMECYLQRCQVDTPNDLVSKLWQEIAKRRKSVGSVVDFGAGDGRFAFHGDYRHYRGYEIDASRLLGARLPENAELVHACAFGSPIEKADVSIGNPPFVRNQDLPDGWRAKVSDRLFAASGIRLSGLANAWQYFFLQSLLCTKDDGLCALIVPFEWVSRPSAAAMRDFIRTKGWDVDVIRLADATFGGVLTTASITLIDKRSNTGAWRYFEEREGELAQMPSPSGSAAGHVSYSSAKAGCGPRVMRGLSPGNQKIFMFTEAERARLGLKPGRDVIRCVSSMRPLGSEVTDLTAETFDEVYRKGGRRCWIINTRRPPSGGLIDYLDSVPTQERSTKTCLARSVWWKFEMPNEPSVLVATSFKGDRPKFAKNSAKAIAVGGVAGISGDAGEVDLALQRLASTTLIDRIVAHANGLFKVEINQLNTLIREP